MVFVKMPRFFRAILAWIEVERADTKSLKSMMWKYAPDVARKLRMPIEKRELKVIVYEALSTTVLEEGFPILAATIAVILVSLCIRSQNLRVRWCAKELALKTLQCLQMLIFLGAMLSWVQPPHGFPRALVSAILEPFVYGPLTVYLPDDVAFFLRPFLPLLLGYLCRELHLRLLIRTIGMRKEVKEPQTNIMPRIDSNSVIRDTVVDNAEIGS
eukprot:g3703.t1